MIAGTDWNAEGRSLWWLDFGELLHRESTSRDMLSASATHSHDRRAEQQNGADVAKCWCCRRSTFRLSIFVFFLTTYLCIGAVCFMWIESPYEAKERNLLREMRARFLHRHICVTDQALEELIANVVQATDRGVSVLNNATVDDDNWSFSQSIFFASTVVTTIGYGHVAPLSEGGKLFCVFFAIVGIPLTLILFTAIIERLSIPAEKFFFLLRRLLPESVSDFHVKVLHLVIILFTHVGLVTLVPAAIFDYIEKDWSYLDSVYFCFVTWTTIGLGDFVPGQKSHQHLRSLYKILSSVYMFLSLISMLFVLKTFHDTPHLNLGSRVYMESDIRADEHLPLQSGSSSGPKYTRQLDEASSTADGLNEVGRTVSASTASLSLASDPTSIQKEKVVGKNRPS